jgi:hypothetical protein
MPVSKRSRYRLEQQRRDDRHQIGVAAALAEPLSVPWIWRTPARTAASELATACSVSLWAWMPRWLPGTILTTSRTISSISCGSVPPLVSHSTTQRAPAS